MFKVQCTFTIAIFFLVHVALVSFNTTLPQLAWDSRLFGKAQDKDHLGQLLRNN